MAVNKERVEGILRLYQALAQRQEWINNVISLLSKGVLFRSPDGALSIELSTKDKQDIKAWLVQYLDESQAIIDSIRAEIA